MNQSVELDPLFQLFLHRLDFADQVGLGLDHPD